MNGITFNIRIIFLIVIVLIFSTLSVFADNVAKSTVPNTIAYNPKVGLPDLSGTNGRIQRHDPGYPAIVSNMEPVAEEQQQNTLQTLDTSSINGTMSDPFQRNYTLATLEQITTGWIEQDQQGNQYFNHDTTAASQYNEATGEIDLIPIMGTSGV